jgi:hypothetical protein
VSIHSYSAAAIPTEVNLVLAGAEHGQHPEQHSQQKEHQAPHPGGPPALHSCLAQSLVPAVVAPSKDRQLGHLQLLQHHVILGRVVLCRLIVLWLVGLGVVGIMRIVLWLLGLRVVGLGVVGLRNELPGEGDLRPVLRLLVDRGVTRRVGARLIIHCNSTNPRSRTRV